jgi:LCP family protein required for cell wall assembly
MRTTLKRGYGRSAAANGNGRAVLPPSVLEELTRVTRYNQPPPPRRSVLGIVVRGFLWLVAAAAVVATGLAGGAYLYIDEDVVAALRPREKQVREAAKELDIPVADQPAIALVVGYDKRAGIERDEVPRSDTVMLVRADPHTKTLSLLSFPRDLLVDIHCRARPVFQARINHAYSECGATGTLRTVRALTGVNVNYLVTVNFRGFQQLVARVGGVWVDVDRRYFNDNSGGEQYATIDLQPGYQKLHGSDSLDFVRYRHADSDLFRLARQQQFVHSFRDALTASFSATSIPKLVTTIAENVQIAAPGDKEIDKQTLWEYALLAYQLRHVTQSKIEGLVDDEVFNIRASTESVRTAVDEFIRPDADAPEKATDAALGRKPPAAKAPLPRDTSVVVLNGNGIAGIAADTSYRLSRLGYLTVTPSVPANAPTSDYFHTSVFFDPKQRRAKAAARKLATLFAPADVGRIPPKIRPLQTNAMVVVVVGQTFNGELAPTSVDRTPTRQPPLVTTNPDLTRPLLREAQKRVRFPLLVPTKIERSSFLDSQVPIRTYKMAGQPAVRLVFTNGASEYWGVQMTSWRKPPILREWDSAVKLGGRRYELHYSGSHLHMVVLRANGATYWVVNTLLNDLSNDTMLAIAKGLRPLR